MIKDKDLRIKKHNSIFIIEFLEFFYVYDIDDVRLEWCHPDWQEYGCPSLTGPFQSYDEAWAAIQKEMTRLETLKEEARI